MFDPKQEHGRPSAAKAPAPQPEARPGLPLDLRRVAHALVSARWVLLLVTIVFASVGAAVGKFVVPKTYRASATVLWEPPSEARADAVRELSTLAQSVKLPENLRAVRQRLALDTTLAGLAASVDVKLGENSMLITTSATSKDRDECATIANTLVEIFLVAQKDVAAGRLREVAAALRASLVLAERSLGDARTAYAKFRAENQISDVSVETQAAIAELARLRVQANDARVDLESLRVREASLKASRDRSPSEVVSSRNERHPAVAKLGGARAELAEARARFTEDHPKTKALEAEVRALKREVARGEVAVTSRVVTRSSVRDNLASQVEELTALRKSIEQRKESLDKVLVVSQSRAAALTTAQSEAARLLASIEVSNKHVGSLLDQIATAEDDVRKASSNFQVISNAAPPAWSERGHGKIVAGGVPLIALMLAAAGILFRSLFPLRAWAACEIAYFGAAPVLWASPWPDADASEARTVSREVADVLESIDGVVGVASASRRGDVTPEFAELVMARLKLRGAACEVVDMRERGGVGDDGLTLADMLEAREVGDEIARARPGGSLVLVLVPSLEQLDAVRAVRRWLDALLVVVDSGQSSPAELWGVRKAIGIEQGSLAYVATRVPEWLVSPGTRAFGLFELGGSWKPPCRQAVIPPG